MGEMLEFGEGGLDALLELLGPPEPSCDGRHVLIHWSPACGGQESLLTQIFYCIFSSNTY